MLRSLLLGILVGVLGGLLPGIHINTLLPTISNFPTAIIVSSIIYTFLDVVPSTFFGVPDVDTAVTVLPAHLLVLEGYGIEAISVSAFSSLVGFLLSLPIFLLFLTFLRSVDPYLTILTPFILITISAFVVVGDGRGWVKALIIFVLSGILGFLFLNDILPLLAGLFSSPVLLASIMGERRIPKQVRSLRVPKLENVVSGILGGTLVSLFPGISSGIATVVATNGVKDDMGVISAMSSANTVNALLCYAVFLSIRRVRSGAVSFIRTLDPILFLELAILSALLGFLLTLAFGIVMGEIVHRIDQRNLSVLALSILLATVIFTCGVHGLFVFSISSIVGAMATYMDVRKINCMGCLILPLLYLRLPATSSATFLPLISIPPNMGPILGSP